ncbi:NUDIX domain-containing protein [Solwaraspora sp. WMMA2056]|uniref:NUDIX hydrolase n=1 Tax=Solwaraspora sp. WMMA2056 TaxID=3015161 RepID=UPI00259BE027|nr:NUDIX domain-containing protein [Solwaraspora sp. WMMA2056]WJK43433.1 NUDIX domain-containing protein [Solwaraspora sp. WMMA2056]
MEKHPFSAAEFADIYGRVPRLTAEVVCVDSRGVVLTRRAVPPAQGKWHLPGGTVYFGEHLHDAVRRVARRELGVAVTVGRMLGYIEYPSLLREGYRGWPVGIAFEATPSGDRLTADEQADEVGWFRSVPPGTLAEQAEFLERFFAAEVSVGRH